MSSAEVSDAASSVEVDEEIEEEQPLGPQKPQKKRGVVFLSRLPTGMKPSQLKQYMMEYGKVQRMWCVPIDKTGKKATVRMPMEAWIEFKSRKRARRVAEALNVSPIGRGRFRDELWNIKYLKGFTWQDLMNQQLHHKKLRDQRLRQRVEHAKRAVNFYLDQKEKQESEEKKSKKRKKPAADDDEAPSQPHPESVKRVFSQTPKATATEENGDLDDNFLSSLLGRSASGPNKRTKKD
jgi:ESF2/ABP1 family protein